ncbi:MAG: protease modulator HflC [Planctomycetes bacterium]|nr:protease modulator HflC [Planctomycetota bacterium]
MKIIIVVALAIVVVLLAWSVFFTVDETQFAIVERFGDPVATHLTPGLKVKWPALIDQAVFFDKRLLVLDLPGPGQPAKEFLTKDKKNIEVYSYACWRIADPLLFLQAVGSRTDADLVLSEIVISELGTVLGQHDLSALLSTDPTALRLEQIMTQIREACAKGDKEKWRGAEEEYGIEIVDFRIKRVNFPDQNRTSVFERMRAERKRIATRYRSEGAEEAAKLQAEADKKRTEILATAYRQAQEIEGQADAEATRIYAEAYGADTEFYEFLRTLESYKSALAKTTTLILPADSPYLSLLRTGSNLMQTMQAPTDSAPPRTSADGTQPQQN